VKAAAPAVLTEGLHYSYGTYIYSMPVTQCVLLFVPGVDVLTLTLLASAATLLLAFLSWELVEKPSLDLRHTLGAAPLPSASALRSFLSRMPRLRPGQAT
jgi:peptidoglycan/LPS O-acetylase OafA/YrhL